MVFVVRTCMDEDDKGNEDERVRSDENHRKKRGWDGMGWEEGTESDGAYFCLTLLTMPVCLSVCLLAYLPACRTTVHELVVSIYICCCCCCL